MRGQARQQLPYAERPTAMLRERNGHVAADRAGAARTRLADRARVLADPGNTMARLFKSTGLRCRRRPCPEDRLAVQ